MKFPRLTTVTIAARRAVLPAAIAAASATVAAAIVGPLAVSAIVVTAMMTFRVIRDVPR